MLIKQKEFETDCSNKFYFLKGYLAKSDIISKDNFVKRNKKAHKP